MGKPRKTSAPSPRSIASLSTALILVSSVGMAFYFGELRGPGLQTFVTGRQVIETGVLCGILVALVVSAHLAIVNAVRQSRTSSPYRAMVRRAAQCDIADPNVTNEFEAAPEVADLVRRLVSQHERIADLSSGLETLRREVQGVAAGMRRSKDDLHPVRQDVKDATTSEITRIWNDLLERVRTAPTAAPKPLSSPATTLVQEFGTVDLGATSSEPEESDVQRGAAFTPAAPEAEGSTQVLSERLGRLETTLQQLAGELRSRASQVGAAPAVPQAAPPAGIAAPRHSTFESVAPEDDTLIWNMPQAQGEADVTPEFSGADEHRAVAPDAFLGAGRAPAAPVYTPASAPFTDHTQVDADAHEGSAPFVAPAASHDIPDVPAFFRPTPAAEPNPEFTEAPEDAAPDASELEPQQFDPSQFEVPRFEVPRFEPPRFEPAAPSSGSGTGRGDKSNFTAPESAFAQQEPSFEDLKFPHFVGQPVRKAQHVEVTYGGNDSGLFVEEDDAGNKEDVVDLRSLGAVEFKE